MFIPIDGYMNSSIRREAIQYIGLRLVVGVEGGGDSTCSTRRWPNDKYGRIDVVLGG